MKSIREFLTRVSANNPLVVTFSVFITATIVVVFLSRSEYGVEFYENILAEAHGMLLDLLVIGVLVYWLNSLGERRRRIERYQEEIEDYLSWEEPEATFRIVGNIRRLNREEETGINLRSAYLTQAKLRGADLTGATLAGWKIFLATISSTICSWLSFFGFGGSCDGAGASWALRVKIIRPHNNSMVATGPSLKKAFVSLVLIGIVYFFFFIF